MARLPPTLLLIRHAEPMPQSVDGAEENERGLSEKGLRDADEIARCFANSKLRAIYSSPYPRARQTVAPLAKRHRLEIKIINDLCERTLSPEPLPDWGLHLRRAWADFDYALPGGESSRAAQARIVRVLANIKAKHGIPFRRLIRSASRRVVNKRRAVCEVGGPRDGIVAVARHGDLISLALNSFCAAVDFNFWAAMPFPAVYQLESTGDGWRIVSGPGF